MRKIVITIDTEALPGRSDTNLVERLIWGRHEDFELGIKKMMSIADQNNVKLSFFVDLCEEALYGKALEVVCKEIVDCGHDFQLHAHPHIMPYSTAKSLGIFNKGVHQQDNNSANALFSYLMDIAIKFTQTEPIAFRGGSFAYNEHILNAMKNYKLTSSYNYSIRSQLQKNNKENLSTFRWDNGITEFPISISNSNFVFEFSRQTQKVFDDINLLFKNIDNFFEERGNDAILVILMHSWSFLDLDKNSGHYKYVNGSLADTFDHFLKSAVKTYKFVTAKDLSIDIDSKKIMPKLWRLSSLAAFE